MTWWVALQDYFTGRGLAPAAGDSDASRNWWYCPSAEETYPTQPRRTYSMNAYGALESVSIKPSRVSTWSQTLIVADGVHLADGDSPTRFRDVNDASSGALTKLDPRHRTKVNGLFMDGHVAAFPLTDPQLNDWITNLKR